MIDDIKAKGAVTLRQIAEDLLRTRESKRENDAFDRGEYLDSDENFQRRA